MTLMNEAIQDRIGQASAHRDRHARYRQGSWLAMSVEPALTRSSRISSKISAILGRERRETPVIEHDEGGLGDRFQELDVAAIAVCDAQFLDESRNAPVEHR